MVVEHLVQLGFLESFTSHGGARTDSKAKAMGHSAKNNAALMAFY